MTDTGANLFHEAGVRTEDFNYDEMTELGQTGLKRFGGIISEEFLVTLMGQRAVEVYREMSTNDPVVSGMLHVIDMLIRQAEWHVDPGEGDGSEEAAEFIEECMQDMADSWEDFISEVLSMLVFGYSFHEIVYKKREGEQSLSVNEVGRIDSKPDSRFKDGKIGWHRLSIRSQDTIISWAIDAESGEILGAWQQAPPFYKMSFIPMEKALLFRTMSHKNNPEGRSLLRGAYRPWYFKKRIEEIEATGIERDLAGLPVGYAPPEFFDANASADKKAVFNAMQEIIVNIRRDEQEGVMFPLAYDEHGNKMFDLSLMSTGGARQFDTNSIIQRYDQRITMAALADFLLVGHNSTGSFALHDDKTDLFAVATGAWLDSIAAILNRQAVPRLLRLNGINVEDPPKIMHGDIESPDLQKMAAYMQTLSGIGMPLFPDDTLEAWLREIAGLPEKDLDAEPTSPLLQQQEAQDDTNVRDLMDRDDTDRRRGEDSEASEGHRKEDREDTDRRRKEDFEQASRQQSASQAQARRDKVKKAIITGDFSTLGE
jgi:hypothetical protein